LFAKIFLVAWYTVVSSFAILFAGGVNAQPGIILSDVTASTGIDFVHTDGSDGRHFLIESMSAGLAMIDFDKDGDLDLYFLNGAPIDRPAPSSPPTNALYRNDGNFQFTDVTEAAKVGDIGFGLGVACADYDNDGFPDIYVNNYGANVLFRNNGDGTYDDLTQIANVANGNLVGGGASFFDMENDGDLDLYVGNYIKFDAQAHRVHIHKGLPSYPSPLGYDPESDTLFRNEGDGTFADVSVASGIRTVAGRSMGLATFDFDADGDIDVFVANDTQENFLFANDGHGKFEEVGFLAGVAYDYTGRAQASMGVEVFDVDRDGRQDLYVTSFSEEFCTLYRNLGNGIFEDATLRAGGYAATFPHVKWGVVAADFDNNGTRDLMVATGDLDDNREKRGGVGSASAYRIPDLLLRVDAKGKIGDMGRDWGSGATIRESGRGLVSGDLDNDGRLDVAVLNARGRPTILKNESPAGNFVKITLVSNRCNRDCLGATVKMQQGNYLQAIQVRSGCSYQSDTSPCVHMGFPLPDQPVVITITWPGRTAPTQMSLHPGATQVVAEPK